MAEITTTEIGDITGSFRTTYGQSTSERCAFFIAVNVTSKLAAS